LLAYAFVGSDPLAYGVRGLQITGGNFEYSALRVCSIYHLGLVAVGMTLLSTCGFEAWRTYGLGFAKSLPVHRNIPFCQDI
jgi:hypothetical protein